MKLFPRSTRTEWVVYGRQHMIGVAHPVLVNVYRGLETELTTGCFHERGGYAGLCQFRVFYMSDGQTWVSISAAPQTWDAADVIVNNLCILANRERSTLDRSR